MTGLNRCPRARCAKVLGSGVRFCAYCGQRVVPARRRSLLPVAAVAAAIVLTLGVWAVAHSREPQPADAPATTSTTPEGSATVPQTTAPPSQTASSSTPAPKPNPIIVASDHPYANSLSKTWLIERPSAQEMRLHFTKVGVGTGDTLVVTDKAGVAAVNFGQGTTGAFYTDWVTGDAMAVVIRSDSAGTGWGFAIDKVETRSYAPAAGSLPETLHPYADNSRFSWTVARPSAKNVRVHFARLELGPGDYLAIRNSSGTLLKMYEKTKQSDFWTAWFPANSLALEFVTNYGDCRYGFKIDKVETQ